MKLIITIVWFTFIPHAQQAYEIKGELTSTNQMLPFANVYLENTSKGIITDAL